MPHGHDDEAAAVRLAEGLRDLGATVGATGAPRVVLRAGRAALPDGTETDANPDTIMDSLRVAWRNPQQTEREAR